MSKKIRVVSAIVDTENLTMYTESGDKVVIPQGDLRVPAIVAHITPILVVKGSVAEVDLEDTSDAPNEFAKFEEKTNGFVKFFRVSRKALARFFGATEAPEVIPVAAAPVPPQVIAPKEPVALVPLGVPQPIVVELPKLPTIMQAPVGPTEAQKMEAAVADIMKHAVPATDKTFNPAQFADKNTSYAKKEEDEKEGNTVVAVVAGKIVPNVEALQTQIANTNQEGKDPKGLQEFLRRLSTVKRQHSVQDLMKFMKRGDLPIADDGSILIYKRLNSHRESGKMVDVHSGKVIQRVGSFVVMDESLVDHNRNNECSNGLHVARRQYLSGFSGDRMVLAKVAPEDVIAVPTYDANKMRVCAYHILFELNGEDRARLIRNEPIKAGTEAARQLAAAMEGNHIGKIEEVRIHGQNGADLKITQLNAEVRKEVKTKDGHAEVEAIETAYVVTGKVLDPAKVETAAIAARAGVEPPAPKVEPTRADLIKAHSLVLLNKSLTLEDRKAAAQKLRDIKQVARTSWLSLGVSDSISKIVVDLLDSGKNPVTETKVAKVLKDVAKKAAPAVEPVKKTNFVYGPTAKIAALKVAALGGDKASANDIVRIKKAAKKSWDVLGLSQAEVKKITTLADK